MNLFVLNTKCKHNMVTYDLQKIKQHNTKC